MPHSITRSQAKIVFLSSLGGMLEFYDFVIFAVFATYIGQVFFPSTDPILSLMAAFAAFAVGYLARPIGGMIFSHFGDRYGRKKSFVMSISIMAIATILMALTPSYHDYGILMSIIFILLRIVQGMAIGGEIPGAITFVTEHVKNRPGFACGVIFLFINLGIFLADGVHSILNAAMSNHDMMQYGWRIAFLIGGVLAIFSYILRVSMHESPEFIKGKFVVAKIPFSRLMRDHKKPMLIGCLIIAVHATVVSLVYLYITSYMMETHLYTEEMISYLTLTTLMLFSISCVVFGSLGDYLGCKRVYIVGTILLLIMSYVFYQALATASFVWISYIVISIICGMIVGNASPVIANMFPTEVRFSGIAFCYNVAFAIFGGLTPLIATALIEESGNVTAPSWILIVVSVFGVIGALLAKKVT